MFGPASLSWLTWLCLSPASWSGAAARCLAAPAGRFDTRSITCAARGARCLAERDDCERCRVASGGWTISLTLAASWASDDGPAPPRRDT